MDDRNWQFPSIGRELALFGLGILAVAGVVGVAIGVGLEILIDRHRDR